MRDDLIKDWFGTGEDPARYDPVRMARAAMKKTLPKRFYEEAAVQPGEGGYQLLLDGRPARTKLRHPLVVQGAAAARQLAQEWAAQVEIIDPALMPLTRILHAAIDHVSGAMAEVRADIVNYAGTDLVCYRALDPEKLKTMQEEHWNPVLDYFAQRHGVRFLTSDGIAHVAQPEASLALVARLLEGVTSPQGLAALHVITTISGSALIALMLAGEALTPEAAFAAGEVDADFEVSVWGSDEEATQRQENRWRDFEAAALLLRAGAH